MSSASETFTGNQQGRKNDKEKNKDLSILVNERLAEINNSMTTLMGRVDDMDKLLKEFESMGDFEELCGDEQVAVNSVVADVNKESQALKASEAAKDAKIQAHEARIKALETQLKVCMATVANMGNGGSTQVSPNPNGNALRPPLIMEQKTRGRSTHLLGT